VEWRLGIFETANFLKASSNGQNQNCVDESTVPVFNSLKLFQIS